LLYRGTESSNIDIAEHTGHRKAGKRVGGRENLNFGSLSKEGQSIRRKKPSPTITQGGYPRKKEASGGEKKDD